MQREIEVGSRWVQRSHGPFSDRSTYWVTKVTKYSVELKDGGTRKSVALWDFAEKWEREVSHAA